MVKNYAKLIYASVTIATILFTSANANAWTAQELVDYCHGVDAFEVMIGGDNQNNWALHTRPVQLSTVEGSPDLIKVSNFAGLFDVYFTVKDNKLVLSDRPNFELTDSENTKLPDYDAEASQLTIQRVGNAYFDGTQWQLGRLKDEGDNWTHAVYTPVEDLPWKYFDMSSEYLGLAKKERFIQAGWHAEINMDQYDNIHIIFGNDSEFGIDQTVKLKYQKDDGTDVANDVLYTYLITLFQHNATITDNKHTTPYPVRITETNGDNTHHDFVITNFNNTGYLAHNYWPYFSPETLVDYFHGYIDGTDVVIEQQYCMTKVEGNKDVKGQHPVSHNYAFFGYTDETLTERQENITGKFYPHQFCHTGNLEWVYTVPGGDLRTTEYGRIKLNPYGIYEKESVDIDYDIFHPITPHNEYPDPQEAIHDININFDNFSKDITFDCELTEITFSFEHDYIETDPDGSWKIYLMVSANLTEKQNPFYTTSYDIYGVEGSYTNVSEINEATNRAQLIATVTTDKSTTYYPVMGKLYPEADILDIFNGNIPYTFYVVAHYETPVANDALSPDETPTSARAYETGNSQSTLTPSYHALTTAILAPGIVTGIDNISAANNPPAISFDNGAIVIANYHGNVEVYNTLGEEIYSGHDTTIDVTPGIYFVHTTNKVTKIMAY